MTKSAFVKIVETALEKMTPVEVSEYALRCAVRVLPFLATPGNFDYWDNEGRKNHLYAIFQGIDAAAIVIYWLRSGNTRAAARDARDARDAIDAIDAIDAAIDAARDAAIDAARDAARFAARFAIDAARDAARYAARFAASYASYAKYADIDADIYAVIDAAGFAARDAARYAARYARYAARYARYAASGNDHYQESWQRLLLDDLSTKQKFDRTLYGDNWNRFQDALRREDCGYWADYYQSLFDSGLEWDINRLTRHFSVPKEIQADGAAAVGHYLEAMAEDAVRLNEARLVILGGKGAGKTCLARRLIDPGAPMTRDKESTTGVETSVWHPDGHDTLIRIWDFAGHVITHAAHQLFLSERCLYIVVIDGRTERDDCEYWLEHVRQYGGNSPAVVLVNERDKHFVTLKKNTLKEKIYRKGVSPSGYR